MIINYLYKYIYTYLLIKKSANSAKTILLRLLKCLSRKQVCKKSAESVQ